MGLLSKGWRRSLQPKCFRIGILIERKGSDREQSSSPIDNSGVWTSARKTFLKRPHSRKLTLAHPAQTSGVSICDEIRRHKLTNSATLAYVHIGT